MTSRSDADLDVGGTLDTFKKATARRPAAVQLTSGDWARRNSYVMVRSEAADAPADGRSGAHLAKVVDVEVDQSSRDKDAHRLTVILLRWSTAQQHWALDADTAQNTQTIPSRVSASNRLTAHTLASAVLHALLMVCAALLCDRTPSPWSTPTTTAKDKVAGCRRITSATGAISKSEW